MRGEIVLEEPFRWVDLNRGQRIVLAGLISNVLLASMQIFAGLWGESRAVLADGIHSTSDILISLIVIISLGIARKPADDSHPFGYGKIESIAAFLVGLVIAGAGVTLIYGAAEAILGGVETVPGALPLGVSGVSIAVKGALYSVTIRTGRELNSPGVLAAAQEYLSCIACSSAAVAGIVGARLGYPVADPIAGLLVAGIIMRVAGRTVWSSVRDLMDAALPIQQVRAVRSAAEHVDGVRRVTLVRTRRMGSRRLVELDIQTDADLVVEEADRVSAQVHARVAGQLDPADEVRVSVAPSSNEKVQREKMAATIRTIVQAHAERFLSFQGPRMIRLGKDLCADVTLLIPQQTSMEQAYGLCQDLERDVKRQYPEMEVIVRLQTPAPGGGER